MCFLLCTKNIMLPAADDNDARIACHTTQCYMPMHSKCETKRNLMEDFLCKFFFFCIHIFSTLKMKQASPEEIK